jgi:Transglutaminase-like superfamily
MRQLYLLLLLIPALAFSQTDAEMDEIARKVPNASSHFVPELAHYFSTKIKDERGRARAIFAWVTLNVKYLDTSDKSEIWATPEHLDLQRPEKVLENRTAVCQGFANLFQALCSAVGIESQVVVGIVKDGEGEVMRLGHAWVAARIQGKWHLFDPTWCVAKPDEGMEVREKYFMMPPEKFVLNHLPDDPAWQLLEYPLRERDFRENDDEGISQLRRRNTGQVFAYQDTLQQWVAMDSTMRSFSSESRILQFNGNNQRILFGLGQQYWSLFFDLKTHLDSMCIQSIVQDSILLDTAYVAGGIKLMRAYHDRARTLFSQITERERIEQTKKFYTPKDVQAITEKIEGSMWTAVFENMRTSTKNAVSERNLQELRRLSDAADEAYERAFRSLDCEKLSNTCFAIWHNRSLAHLRLAERYSLFSKNLMTEKNAENHLPVIETSLKSAKELYGQAADECRKLMEIPPPYEFVKERLLNAEKGLFVLKVRNISARRIAIGPAIAESLKAEQKNTSLLKKLTFLLDDVAEIATQVEERSGKFGQDFKEVNLFNLHNESYSLNFSMSRLCYIDALNQYNRAVDDKSLRAEKSRIEAVANEAISWLKQARQSMEFLEKSGRSSEKAIEQREQQVGQLANGIREVLRAL